MANIKSAIKRIRTSEKRRQNNKARISRVRTFIKKVELAIQSGNATDAKTALQALQPEIQRSAAKGAMHKNTAARTVSRLAGNIKSMEKAA